MRQVSVICENQIQRLFSSGGSQYKVAVGGLTIWLQGSRWCSRFSASPPGRLSALIVVFPIHLHLRCGRLKAPGRIMPASQPNKFSYHASKSHVVQTSPGLSRHVPCCPDKSCFVQTSPKLTRQVPFCPDKSSFVQISFMLSRQVPCCPDKLLCSSSVQYSPLI